MIDEINECGNDATTEIIVNCQSCRHIDVTFACDVHIKNPGTLLSRANEHVCR
jgi:hypothetical protein